MRFVTAVSLLVLATALLPIAAGQDGVPSAQAARPAVRVAVEASDLLTHSPFADCSTDAQPSAPIPPRLRIATWNIRAARSAPVSAIAAELQAMEADVVALQEVDVRTRRTGFVDEPAMLAAALGFHFAFAASIKWDEGDYGLAVLSRWPLMQARRYRLDTTQAGEPRIVLEVTVCVRGRSLHLFNHHADGRLASRNTGFAELNGIAHADIGRGILVVGDFNEQADGPGVRGLIDAGLVDLGADRNVSTTDGGRIDYLLADGVLARRTSTARVWPTDKSDHYAVVADLEVVEPILAIAIFIAVFAIATLRDVHLGILMFPAACGVGVALAGMPLRDVVGGFPVSIMVLLAAAAFARIDWSTVFVVGGIVTFVGVLQKLGAVDLLGHGAMNVGTPLFAALVICMTAGLVSAFASTTGILAALVPLAVPLATSGGVSDWGLISALSVCAAIVDVSPFSTTGATLVASAPEEERARVRTMTLRWGMSMVVVGPVAFVALLLVLRGS